MFFVYIHLLSGAYSFILINLGNDYVFMQKCGELTPLFRCYAQSDGVQALSFFLVVRYNFLGAGNYQENKQ